MGAKPTRRRGLAVGEHAASGYRAADADDDTADADEADDTAKAAGGEGLADRAGRPSAAPVPAAEAAGGKSPADLLDPAALVPAAPMGPQIRHGGEPTIQAGLSQAYRLGAGRRPNRFPDSGEDDDRLAGRLRKPP